MWWVTQGGSSVLLLPGCVHGAHSLPSSEPQFPCENKMVGLRTPGRASSHHPMSTPFLGALTTRSPSAPCAPCVTGRGSRCQQRRGTGHAGMTVQGHQALTHMQAHESAPSTSRPAVGKGFPGAGLASQALSSHTAGAGWCLVPLKARFLIHHLSGPCWAAFNCQSPRVLENEAQLHAAPGSPGLCEEVPGSCRADFASSSHPPRPGPQRLRKREGSQGGLRLAQG